MVLTVLAEGPADPARGWSNFVGLMAGAFVCWALWRYDKYRQKGKPAPSPTTAPTPRLTETPQVRRISSRPSHETPADETPAGEPVETHWWGAIEQVKGGARRVYRTVQHVAATGNSPDPDDINEDIDDEQLIDEPDEGQDEELPALESVEAYEPPAGGGFDVDIPLGEADEVIVPEPVIQRRETRQEYAVRLIGKGAAKPAAVAGLIEHYGVSRATAYRIVEQASATRVA
jgi:hypothetical protein